ncbi:MAG: Oligopeptide transport system permease protein OppC [Candidatus Izimaplasma bacterium HR2]|nr:MAG: Oligopeptide transport system permease protein OppC [Candidatus Izimaplasma bacterium HR2]
MKKNRFDFLDSTQKLDKEQIRKSLTYWQDVWRRLRKNKLSILGLIGVVVVLLFATVGQLINPHGYDVQNRDFKNVPPSFEIYKIDDDMYVYLTEMYLLILVNEDGKLLDKFDSSHLDGDPITKIYNYRLLNEADEEIALVEIDFSYSTDPLKADENILYSINYKGIEYKETYDKVWNKSFLLGTDTVGRDLLSRVMYGTGISLTIAFVAAFINFFVGVLYGSFAGFFGGRTDNIMMRIVDIINSIPLLLYVILLMVVIKDSSFEAYVLDPIFGAGGLGTIIVALISVYWVGMARLVRGQVLSLKEQEYVLAARTIGVSNFKIVTKHLIPNALGPIIVTMTMMIPAAVFTEAFLSFIGLGISAPRSSLGTLTSAGAEIMQTYAYQLLVPAFVIAFMMLSFNFLGDGLRDALDPRLRKG